MTRRPARSSQATKGAKTAGPAAPRSTASKLVLQGSASPARVRPPSPLPSSGMRLHTVDGARKYLTAGERDAFLRAAEQADRHVRTLL